LWRILNLKGKKFGELLKWDQNRSVVCFDANLDVKLIRNGVIESLVD
jgi:hypothetical protein